MSTEFHASTRQYAVVTIRNPGILAASVVDLDSMNEVVYLSARTEKNLKRVIRGALEWCKALNPVNYWGRRMIRWDEHY